MPLPWVWPPFHEPNLAGAPPPTAIASQAQRKSIDGELVVEWRHETATANPRVLRFTGGVKAIYGQTTLYADELTLFLDESDRHGEATGHVKLDDPAGTATSDRLSFNWRTKSGQAFTVDALVEGVHVQAREVDITPDRWDIYDFTTTNWRGANPLYLLTSRHAVIEPGRSAVINKPHLNILGMRLGPLPSMRTSLDSRAGNGLGFPSVSYERNRGIGVAWNGSMLLNDTTALNGNFGAFKHYSPSYGLQMSRSLLPSTITQQSIVPRTDLDERFNGSYFENVNVRSVDRDELSIRSPRRTVAIGTFQNVSPSDRLENAHYDKPFDIVFEGSGKSLDLGYYGQIRYQAVRRQEGVRRNRIVLQSTLDALPRPIAKNVELHTRLDSAGYFGGTQFGWTRASVGLTYEPSPTFTFGASTFWGSESGDSLFADDRLYVRQGYTARASVNLGPTRLSVLGKWNAETGELFDREFEIIQVINGLEAYAVYRKFPGDYRLGIQLRIESFMTALRSRKASRPSTP